MIRGSAWTSGLTFLRVHWPQQQTNTSKEKENYDIATFNRPARWARTLIACCAIGEGCDEDGVDIFGWREGETGAGDGERNFFSSAKVNGDVEMYEDGREGCRGTE